MSFCVLESVRCLHPDKSSSSMKKTVKVSDLRVIDLRRELSNRSLDKTGLKPVLLERLRNALAEKGENSDAIIVEENDQDGALGHLTNEDDEDELSSDEDKKTLKGIAIAKQLSRAAIEGPESPLMSNTPMSTPTGSPMCTPTGSHTFSQKDQELDDSSGHDGDLSADQVRESTHLSVTALQTLLSKIDGLHDSLDRERTEARDKEQRMYSKITELEKVLTALPKIEALTHTLEKEREEARDREQRLSNKIRELEKTIANLNTSVEESLKTCNTKLDKLSLRQHRPQTPEKRPANGGGQGAQTMQTDTGRSGRTHAPDSESSRSAASCGEQTTDLHADNSPSTHGHTNRAAGQGLPSSHEDAGVASKSAGKNHDNCNRTDVPPGSTLTVSHAERSLPESYADAASTRRTNMTESDQPATTQDTTQTSNSPTLPSDEKWTKKTPRRPKPNTGSKNPVDKKPLGKLLGAERIIKAVYYLGGISPNCAADDIVSFCRPYCNILDCRILSSKRTGTQAARLVIDKRTCSTLEKVEWPEHVFLQKWNFPVINATEGNPKAQPRN